MQIFEQETYLIVVNGYRIINAINSKEKEKEEQYEWKKYKCK